MQLFGTIPISINIRPESYIMKISLIATASLLILAGAAQAQSLSSPTGLQFPMLQGGKAIPSSEAKSNQIVESFLARNKVSIGATMQQETYTETKTKSGDKIMQEKGILYGVTVGFEQQLTDIQKIQYKGTLLMGSSDYTGSLMSGNYGDLVLKGQSRHMYDLSATYKISPDSWHGLSVGAGLGYRNLVDNLQEAGSGGYKRENSNVYASFGIERSFGLSPSWTVNPGLAIKKAIYSRQFSEISDGVLLSHDQKDVSGTELSAAFVKQNSNGTKLAVTPFIRAWSAADSTVIQGTLEPKNKTSEVGLTVAIQF